MRKRERERNCHIKVYLVSLLSPIVFLGERFPFDPPDDGNTSSTPVYNETTMNISFIYSYVLSALMLVDPFNFLDTLSPVINLSILPSSSARANHLAQ